jgi:hypothetical protein
MRKSFERERASIEKESDIHAGFSQLNGSATAFAGDVFFVNACLDEFGNSRSKIT